MEDNNNCAGDQHPDKQMSQRSTKHHTSKLSTKSDLIDDSMSMLLEVRNLVSPSRGCKRRLEGTSYANKILAELIADYSMNSFDEYGDVSGMWSKNEVSSRIALDPTSPVRHTISIDSIQSESYIVTKSSSGSDSNDTRHNITGRDAGLNTSPQTSSSHSSGQSFNTSENSSDVQRVPSPNGHDLILELMSRSQYCAHSIENEQLHESDNKTRSSRNNSTLGRVEPDGAEEYPVRHIAVASRRLCSRPSSVRQKVSKHTKSKQDRRSGSSHPSSCSASSRPLASSTMIADTSLTDSRCSERTSAIALAARNESGHQVSTTGVISDTVVRGHPRGASFNSKKRMRSLHGSSNLHKIDDSQYPPMGRYFSSEDSTSTNSRSKHSSSSKRKRQRKHGHQDSLYSESESSLCLSTATNTVGGEHVEKSSEKQSSLPRTSTTVWSLENSTMSIDNNILKPLNGQRCSQAKSQTTRHNNNRSSHISSFDYDYTCTDSSEWYTDDIENTFDDILVPNNSCYSTANCENFHLTTSRNTNPRYSFLLTSCDDNSTARQSKSKSLIRRTSTPLPSHCLPSFRRGCKRSHSDRQSGFDKRTLKQRLKDFRQSCSRDKTIVPTIRTLARL